MAEEKCAKPFRTYEQLIKKLDEKKLDINDSEYIIKLLKRHSYFALISGYKEPFKDKKGDYKIHTTIQDIYALYCFDEALRDLFLRYILKIEKHVKSLISYSFCEIYGEDQRQYLSAVNYDYNIKNQDDINELVTRLTKITTETQNYPYISHQKRKYGNIPLWVMMKALTLGTVSKMYSFLMQNIKQKVSKEFRYVHESMLAQMLDLLARVRNVCAHNERLYDYKYRKGTIDDTGVHIQLGIPKKKGQFIKGKNDLFAVVIVLKYLLDEDEFEGFVEELENLFDDLFNKTRIIQRTQVYKYMGFPENWSDIKMVCR